MVQKHAPSKGDSESRISGSRPRNRQDARTLMLTSRFELERTDEHRMMVGSTDFNKHTAGPRSNFDMRSEG